MNGYRDEGKTGKKDLGIEGRMDERRKGKIDGWTEESR